MHKTTDKLRKFTFLIKLSKYAKPHFFNFTIIQNKCLSVCFKSIYKFLSLIYDEHIYLQQYNS